MKIFVKMFGGLICLLLAAAVVATVVVKLINGVGFTTVANDIQWIYYLVAVLGVAVGVLALTK